MTVIVTDQGFAEDNWEIAFTPMGEAANDAPALDVPSNADPEIVPLTPEMIRVDVPSFADGRAFTIARILRLRGYKGRLRARGHVLADQYAMARRSGFDEVEISQEFATRQPETDWVFRANWQAHDYQTRLRGQRLGG